MPSNPPKNPQDVLRAGLATFEKFITDGHDRLTKIEQDTTKTEEEKTREARAVVDVVIETAENFSGSGFDITMPESQRGLEAVPAARQIVETLAVHVRDLVHDAMLHSDAGDDDSKH